MRERFDAVLQGKPEQSCKTIGHIKLTADILAKLQQIIEKALKSPSGYEPNSSEFTRQILHELVSQSYPNQISNEVFRDWKILIQKTAQKKNQATPVFTASERAAMIKDSAIHGLKSSDKDYEYESDQ